MNDTNAKHANSNCAMSWRITENILAATAGIGAGAGLMYFCDPHRGRERRHRLADGAASLLHRDEHKLQKRAKDVLNRVEGFVAEAASALASDEPVPDEVLAERVRSRMGHILSDPKTIEIRAHNGVVTLEGRLTHAEKRMLKEEVKEITGVRQVNDRLKSPAEFAPGLLLWIGAAMALLRNGPTQTVPAGASSTPEVTGC